MLQPRVLPKIIEQANTDGVKTTLLLNTNGSLLASAGSNKELDKLVAAIVANIWSSYTKAGKTAFNPPNQQNQDSFMQQQSYAYDDEEDEHLDDDMMDDDQQQQSHQQQHQQQNEPLIIEKLTCLLVDCESGRLAITGVSSKVILCLCAEKSVEFGLLKAKALVVKDFLKKPFEMVESAEEE